MTTEAKITDKFIDYAINHMNEEHQDSLLYYAQAHARCDWAQSATMTKLDATGFELLVVNGDRIETHHITFPQPASDPQELRMALVTLAQQVGSAGT